MKDEEPSCFHKRVAQKRPVVLGDAPLSGLPFQWDFIYKK